MEEAQEPATSGRAAAEAGPRRKPTPSRRQLGIALKAAGGGSWDWHPQENRVEQTTACWQMLGFEPGGFGRTAEDWISRVHPEDRAAFDSVVAPVLAGREEVYRLVIRLKTYEDTWRRVLTTGRLHETDPEGRATRIVGILLDVEPEERLRERVERQKLELETRVRELEARNEELARFTHVASHDLRSPIRTIRGFASHLDETLPASSPARDFAQRIDRAGLRMTGLLDSLLEYAASGRARSRFEAIRLGDVVAEVIEDLHAECVANPVCVAALPELRADARELRQMFQNLIANAFKHAGGPAARVSVTAEPSGVDGRVRVCVADAGAGIDEAHREAVFQPFERMSRAGTPGSGVGLAIVQRLVANHGGRVWVGERTGALPTRLLVELPLDPESVLPADLPPPLAGDPRYGAGC